MSAINKEEINKKISKAKADLIIEQPFFATMLLNMPMVEREDIPTAATDGEKIFYNPEFIDTLTINELVFLLCHEVMHCVFDHMGRRETRDQMKYNMAADYCINEILEDEKIGTVIKGALLDRNLTQKGDHIAEKVYNLLPDRKQEQGKGKGKGKENNNGKPFYGGMPNGPLDDIIDAGKDAATKAEKSANLKVRVMQARNSAKMQGKLSVGVDRVLKEVLKPKVDWKEYLRRFISAKAKIETTWARPKRRFLGEDLYLPSMGGEKINKILVGIDCSGSISEELLGEFSTELDKIRLDLRPSEIEVIYFDTRITRIEKIDDNDNRPIGLKPNGGGGTCFKDMINYAEKTSLNEQVDCLIVFTDLFCNSFGKDPCIPTLWAYYENENPKVPFGETIEVKLND